MTILLLIRNHPRCFSFSNFMCIFCNRVKKNPRSNFFAYSRDDPKYVFLFPLIFLYNIICLNWSHLGIDIVFWISLDFYPPNGISITWTWCRRIRRRRRPFSRLHGRIFRASNRNEKGLLLKICICSFFQYLYWNGKERAWRDVLCKVEYVRYSSRVVYS